MNRFFIIAVILAAAGYLIYAKRPVKQNEPIVYGEARITFNVPGREIEAVAIGQRYGTKECRRDSPVEKFNEMCGNDSFCVETKYECKVDVDAQYKGMLDKQAARTHYVHLQHKTNDLEGILLFWGLTDEESQAFCSQFIKRIDTQNGIPVVAQCI
jgi:hypothetical protein